MARRSFQEQLLEELPRLLAENEELRRQIVELVRPYFADRAVTEGRFEAMLAELQRQREESERRWQVLERRWRELKEESDRRWAEMEKRWRELKEESDRRWEESLRRWEEMERRWRELKEESDRRWEEWHQTWKEFLEKRYSMDFKRLDRRLETVLGSIGSRWGLKTEGAFRNAIVGILREYVPDVQVQRLRLRDEKGEVFHEGAEVEMDLFIHNGRWILGEIKASLDADQVRLFVRKARWVQKQLGREVDRLMIIAPMADKRAREVARALGVTVYTFPDEAAEAFED